MTFSRFLAGISLLALIAAQAVESSGECRTAEVSQDCGCPAPDPEENGAAITAPCCCGCAAPSPQPPDREGKAPLQAPTKDSSSATPPARVDVSVAPPVPSSPEEPIAFAPSPTPPLFLLHHSFRK